MANLKSFVIELALDADLMQRYSKDPQAVLRAAGLSADEQAALLSGDAAQLRTALGRPDNDCMSQTGIALRRAETAAKLSLAATLPLEQTVVLPFDIEMDVREGGKIVTKVYKAGTSVTRHKKLKKKKKQQPVSLLAAKKKAKKKAKKR